MARLRLGLVLLAALGLLPAATAAQQQSQSSSQQKDKDKDKEKDKPKPKAKRVWSEDDVKELRKPWDQVEEPKKEEAKPGEAALADKPAASTDSTTAPENDLPKTLGDAQKQLDAKFVEVRAQQELVAGLQRELYDTSSDQSREELRARIEKARTKLLEAQMEFKKINEIRDELRAKEESKEGAPAAETKPPAQTPPQTPPPAAEGRSANADGVRGQASRSAALKLAASRGPGRPR